MADDMIERVARAMWERSHEEPWTAPSPADSSPKCIYMEDARAAIKAMWEPTDEMVQAAMPIAFAARVSQRTIWTRMIDAALISQHKESSTTS